MKKIQEKFIDFSIRYRVLQFGEFTLKSGRISPYFFNASLFQDGVALRALGQAYADLYQAHGLQTPHLFGPAYKGIILATMTSMALAEVNINTTVTFNRKEAKTHGEGGVLIGAPLKGPTTIIDDVITAGTAFRESKALIEAQGAQVHSVLIALDRCERGISTTSTIEEIRAQGIQVLAIIDLFDVVDYLKRHGEHGRADAIEAYQKTYAPT